MALIIPAALKAAFKIYAANEASAIISDVAVGPFQDRADFIRDGSPTSTVARIDQQVARATCRRWARGEVGGSPIRDANLRSVCTPYLNDIGESPDGVIFEAPFSGGQCSFEYVVNMQVNFALDQNPDDIITSSISTSGVPGSPVGPLTGVVVAPASSFSLGGSCATGNTTAVGVGSANGNFLIACYANATVLGASITSVTPANPANTDDCGDPPPEYDGPGGRCPGCVAPVDPVVITDDPDYDDIEVNVTFPDDQICVEINGDVTCFELDPDDGEEEEEPGGINPGNSGEPKDGEGFLEGSGSTGPGGQMGSDGGQDIGFGPPPEGYEWVGCRVEVDPDVRRFGEIAGSAPENAVFPRVVGNLSLNTSAGRQDAVRLRSQFSFHFRQHPTQVVTGAKITLSPGTGFAVFPLAVKTCPDPLCLPEEEENNDE